MDREQALIGHLKRIRHELGKLIDAEKEKKPYISKAKQKKCFYCGSPCSVKFCDICRPRAQQAYIDANKPKMKAYQKAYQKAYRDRKRKERQGR